MSLREELKQAQAEARQMRLNREKREISTALAEMAEKLPGSLRNIIGKTRANLDPADSDSAPLKSLCRFKTMGMAELTLPILETLPGYRKLHETCSSEAVDVCLNVSIGGSEGDAWIQFRVDPQQAFQKSTFKGHDERNGVGRPLGARLAPLPAEADPKSVNAPRLNL